MSSFFDLDLPDEAFGAVLLVLMSELSWEVKERVDDEDMGFPIDKFRRLS